MSEFQDQVLQKSGFIYRNINRGVFAPGAGVGHETEVDNTVHSYQLMQRAFQVPLEEAHKLASVAGDAWEHLLVQRYSDTVKTISCNGSLSRQLIEDFIIEPSRKEGVHKNELTLIGSSPFESLFNESFEGINTWNDAPHIPRLDNELNHVPFYKEEDGVLHVNQDFITAPWHVMVVFHPKVMKLEIPDTPDLFEPRELPASASGTGFPALRVVLQAAIRPVQPTLGMVVQFKASGPKATEFRHV